MGRDEHQSRRDGWKSLLTRPFAPSCAQRFNVGDIGSVLHKSRRDGSILAMSYISSYFHCVFSTTERRPLIPPKLQERLWPYLGGIARQNGMTPIKR
jgi:hypothetical protein